MTLLSQRFLIFKALYFYILLKYYEFITEFRVVFNPKYNARFNVSLPYGHSKTVRNHLFFK